MEDINSYLKLKTANKFKAKLWELIKTYYKMPYYSQEFQKCAYKKNIKPRIYIFKKNTWLHSKYINIKYNLKLEVKFFKLFHVFYSVKKQVYKLKLLKKWRIYDVFYILFLEQNTIKNG